VYRSLRLLEYTWQLAALGDDYDLNFVPRLAVWQGQAAAVNGSGLFGRDRLATYKPDASGLSAFALTCVAPIFLVALTRSLPRRSPEYLEEDARLVGAAISVMQKLAAAAPASAVEFATYMLEVTRQTLVYLLQDRMHMSNREVFERIDALLSEKS
jgi:hypothetical protein